MTTKAYDEMQREFDEMLKPIPEEEMNKIHKEVQRIIPLLMTSVRRKRLSVDGVMNKMATIMKDLEFLAYEGE